MGASGKAMGKGANDKETPKDTKARAKARKGKGKKGGKQKGVLPNSRTSASGTQALGIELRKVRPFRCKQCLACASFMEENDYDESWNTSPGESWGDSSWRDDEWWWSADDWTIFLTRLVMDARCQPLPKRMPDNLTDTSATSPGAFFDNAELFNHPTFSHNHQAG